MSQLVFGIPREYAFLFFHNNWDTAAAICYHSATGLIQNQPKQHEREGERQTEKG
jgi:hypothetical protein